MPGLLPDPGKTRLVHGISEEFRAFAVSALALETSGTAVLLTTHPIRAEAVAIECRTHRRWIQSGTEVLYFPERPTSEMDATKRSERECNRMAVLSALLKEAPHPRLVITTPEALLGSCPNRKQFEAQQIRLRVGDKTSFSKLVQRLTQALDYDNEVLCEFPGQIAVRGGLLDIYPCNANQPYRIDFFSEEIESIRTFDPTTQRTQSTTDLLVIADREHFGEGICDGTLMHYLPEMEITWLLDEPSGLMCDSPLLLEKVTPPDGASSNTNPPFKLRDQSSDRYVALCELHTDSELFKKIESIELANEPVAHYRMQADPLQAGHGHFETATAARRKFESQIANWANQKKLDIFFVTQSDTEAERIRILLKENPETTMLEPVFLKGVMTGGFICRQNLELHHSLTTFLSPSNNGFVLITAHEFFGHHRKPLRARTTRALQTVSQVDQMLDFTELVDGDLLVHLQHGICLFRGVSKMEIEGSQKEMISVEFLESMTLHVPLYESHLLTRYVGLTKKMPPLGKIGGKTWKNTRHAAETAALDYAADLLHLHARRCQSAGHAFPPDHVWQKEFEDAFPFKETPDQLHAIKATKEDMEKPEPMDRLICGDVGFGKTEVAIRAAMKAVLSGKQVAVLVPTTVLCQQHLNTFRQRMAPYPINIDQVSRFRTPAQNRQMLADLTEGKIDIAIGTHRLLSKDVCFQDLGLLIIDEEQRFGVKQKEAMKQLRTNVDILTLSATPIPRTLHMALAGARTISVIETPPDERKPIETIVKSYDPDLVKNAIQAEVDQGGQVFYLHNRISTISHTAKQIRDMHPKLKVAVGHGQMEGNQLEQIMTQFVAGQFDVLVCTTIIESGIDIPNCNTLIIEGADRFGLAQLYQIRGRVGRFKHQAYAYLLLHRHAPLVNQARKRLHALKQHNQAGAGLRIAMRDLELRGAGNLLGTLQSGHIAGVGFELYCHLIRKSIARLKNEPGADRIRAKVTLDFIAGNTGAPVSLIQPEVTGAAAINTSECRHSGKIIEACIPPDYITEIRLRIDFCRKIALAETREAISEIAGEMVDRFGSLPKAVQALVIISEIRVLAELAGLRQVETENARLICRFGQTKSKGEFLKIGRRFPRLTAKDPFSRLDEIRSILQRHLPR